MMARWSRGGGLWVWRRRWKVVESFSSCVWVLVLVPKRLVCVLLDELEKRRSQSGVGVERARRRLVRRSLCAVEASKLSCVVSMLRGRSCRGRGGGEVL
jgi:hypothetical protein